jgi:plastocyanin
LALAGLAGLAVAALPTIASGDPPSSGSFTAVDDSWNAGGGGNSVSIAPGGTVTFSYPTGFTSHNADFTGSAPSSCTQTTGTNSGAVPPLPHNPTTQGWSGTCTFNAPGTYTFQCDMHPFMTGSVVVGSGGGTTTTTTTTTTGPQPSTSTTTTTSPSPGPTSPNPPSIGPNSSPLAGSASQAVHVAHSQRGTFVRGTAKISPAGVGGTLQVTLLAQPGGALLGRISVKLHAGNVKFSVPLGRTGKHALSRRGRLSLEIKIVVRGTSGNTVRTSRRVALRR